MEAGQGLDRQPRPGVRPKKSARDRLIRLARARPDWAVGFVDEVWWSRVAQPAVRAWAADRPLRLVEQAVAPGEPKALACYGLLARWWAAPDAAPDEALWLRFVEGRPLSALTTRFLAWGVEQLAAAGKAALLLVWDNASWHISHEVRDWIAAHNRRVKEEGAGGVRIVPCPLPTKSPWLNPIEPKWAHGKKRIVEPARLLTVAELEERVYAALDADHADHPSVPQQAA